MAKSSIGHSTQAKIEGQKSSRYLITRLCTVASRRSTKEEYHYGYYLKTFIGLATAGFLIPSAFAFQGLLAAESVSYVGGEQLMSEDFMFPKGNELPSTIASVTELVRKGSAHTDRQHT
jgi:hypothetical protein